MFVAVGDKIKFLLMRMHLHRIPQRICCTQAAAARNLSFERILFVDRVQQPRSEIFHRDRWVAGDNQGRNAGNVGCCHRRARGFAVIVAEPGRDDLLAGSGDVNRFHAKV